MFLTGFTSLFIKILFWFLFWMKSFVHQYRIIHDASMNSPLFPHLFHTLSCTDRNMEPSRGFRERQRLGSYQEITKGFPDLAQPNKDEHGGRQTDRQIKRHRGRMFFVIRVERIWFSFLISQTNSTGHLTRTTANTDMLDTSVCGCFVWVCS